MLNENVQIDLKFTKTMRKRQINGCHCRHEGNIKMRCKNKLTSYSTIKINREKEIKRKLTE